MKKTVISLVLMSQVILASAQSTFGYRNPVIPGFHPDPSVCRVEKDYYIVTSSFQYFPGVPIYHSRDLVNWEQIGNVLDRPSQLPLDGASSWLGIYAPTIRYYDGVYYMVTTNVGNGGNFFVTATNPGGPWSEPIWLKQQGIDPSFYFEDGKCYMVSNPNDAIWLCQIDPKTGEQLTESRQLWQGTGGRYPEGPHLYKKDGYYYLLISEGGTEYGHSITIARSRNIEGPYESNPDNPILCHQRRITQAHPIQGTGHADLVETHDGKWWMVFLAFRTYNGNYHHLGRETFVAPVEWSSSGWPVVNGNGTVDTLMKVTTMPQLKIRKKTGRMYLNHDDMSDPRWIYMQTPKSQAVVMEYKDDDHPACLMLEAGSSTLTENNHPAFLGMRQESAVVTTGTMVSLPEEGNAPVEAGFTVYQINDGHYDIYVRRDSDGQSYVGLRCKVKSVDYVVKEVALTNDESGVPIQLQVASDGAYYSFSYHVAGQQEGWLPLGKLDCSLLSSEVVGGFTGVTLGMYATSPVAGQNVAFRYFDYYERELKQGPRLEQLTGRRILKPQHFKKRYY